MASREAGFSTEERSPGSSPVATARMARRTILALRVFGQLGHQHHPGRRERLPQVLGHDVSRTTARDRRSVDGRLQRRRSTRSPRPSPRGAPRPRPTRRRRDARRARTPPRPDPAACRPRSACRPSARAGTRRRPRRCAPSRRAPTRRGTAASTCPGSARRRPTPRASSTATAAGRRARPPRPPARASRPDPRRRCPSRAPARPRCTR